MFEKVFNEELKINTKDYPFMINLPSVYDFKAKKYNCELFFEHFDFNHFFMANESLLNLYGNAKISGTVVNIGHSFVTVDSILEGSIIPYASKK